jgi:MFS family permease
LAQRLVFVYALAAKCAVQIPKNPTSSSQFRAWLVVLGAFLGAFVSFGVTYTFGVFLKPIALEFHVGHATMSVLFSIIAALTFFVAPFTGKLADQYGPRPVVGTGAVLICVALVATSRVHSFSLLLLTYGGGLGCAAACIYIPAISAVGEWFEERRDIALGIAISGIGCGTLVSAPLSAMLIERYGWRSAFIVFGWSSGVLLLLATALLSQPSSASPKKRVPIKDELHSSAFRYLYLGLLFGGIAIFMPLVYIPAYATDIGVSRVAGAAVIGYIGAASVVGRLALNALAPRFGLFAMYQTSFSILLLSFGLWLTAHSYTSLVVFGLVMGVGYGGIAAMAPAVTCAIFGVAGLGELLGILYTGFGLACIIGPPLAGILVDYTHDYKWPVFVGTVAAILALSFAIPLKRSKNEFAEERAAA